VQVGELDRVADLLDLPGEAADVGVGDVRDLFEDELLDLGLGNALVDVAGAGSSSSESPARITWSSSGAASRTIRSSSACEMTRARSPSASTSLSITTSPIVS
jgi:hypothetical protein